MQAKTLALHTPLISVVGLKGQILGSIPPFHSLFVNLAMVSHGNAWTLHPSIPDIILAIEPQMIVTLLTSVCIN